MPMRADAPARLWRRLAASLYDLLPLLGLWFLVAALAIGATGGEVDVAHPPRGFRLALQAALGLVTAAYFAGSWWRGGQTIGMRAWGLRVVAGDGPVGLGQACLRFAAALVSLLALGLGFFWCVIDPQRRAWHDLVAGTRVIGPRA